MNGNTNNYSGCGTAACVRIGLICCFLFLLFLPPLATIWMPKQDFSKVENRKLASFPNFQQTSAGFFVKLFEQYVSDHLVFRKTLSYFYNRIVIVIFNKSPLPGIVLGQKGWLFRGSEGSMEDILGKKTLSEESLKTWARKLQGRKNFLERQGVRYLFFIAPEKESIYPEYLPESFQKRMTNRKRIDQLIAFLKKNTDIPIVDLRPTLLREKAHQQLYYRTDFHWNYIAGWIAYQEIFIMLQSWFPEIRRLDEHSVDIFESRFDQGDLAVQLGLTDIFNETERVIRVSESCVTEVKNLRNRFNNSSFLKICPKSSRRAVVFRDSYFCFIEPFMSECFHTSIYIWKPWPNMDSYDHEWMKEILQEFKPDLVIEEHAERFLDAKSIVSNEEEFEYAKTVVLLDPLHGFDQIVAYKEVELKEYPDGLHITAGNDPGVVLQLEAVRRQDALLQLVIDSPAETMLQLFFKYRPLDGYSEVNSMRFKMHPGTNELTIPLKHQWVGNPLRVDPGTVAGVYVLKKLELRLLPSIGG
uniref:AlgX/AlgJ SGNH hydrolase-like domain-containing protein n=1 Tax=Desulfatirhabdium butyrativorans TaxID=340467 RepID=A0A7C4RN19_9BACT